MHMENQQASTPRPLIRREKGWYRKNWISYRAGELTLTKDRITFYAHSASTQYDTVILLKDVEKVKMTRNDLIYQDMGIYTGDRQLIFQVKNAPKWIDEINNAIAAAKEDTQEPVVSSVT